MTNRLRFILVPYLLGVYVRNDYGNWQNGPEYTFNATVSSLSDQTDFGKYIGSSLSTTLKCQPKEPDRLRCRFEDTKITKLKSDVYHMNATVPPENAEYREFGFGNLLFEIKFNEEGIEEYLFDADQPLYYLLNMYRLIANQLSVWSQVRTVKGWVAKFENTTVGQCPVNYHIWKKDEPSMTTRYALSWYRDEAIIPEEAMQIARDIDLYNCIPHWVYKMETRHTFGVVSRESMEKLRSSLVILNISQGSFTSEGINVVNLYDSNGKPNGIEVLDVIRLSLVSVEPAQSVMKEMSKLKSVSQPLFESDDSC